ncbi:hypothetical protein AURDEDRAFT_126417 [Auricularia subglabra TFB-10046 SS5]|nr:hypothetical protein AURDEDRAFT_126417 [Auricularia subglabra TFB-10046 SS5]
MVHDPAQILRNALRSVDAKVAARAAAEENNKTLLEVLPYARDGCAKQKWRNMAAALGRRAVAATHPGATGGAAAAPRRAEGQHVVDAAGGGPLLTALTATTVDGGNGGVDTEGPGEPTSWREDGARLTGTVADSPPATPPAREASEAGAATDTDLKA